MASRTATLVARLVDDVSKPAGAIAKALHKTAAEADALGKLRGAGGGGRLVSDLQKLGASAWQVDKVTAALKKYAASQGVVKGTDWTKAQAQAVRTWERSTVANLRAVTKAQDDTAASARRLAAAQANAAAKIARAHRAEAAERERHNRRHGVIGATAGAAAGYVSAHSIGHGVVDTIKAGGRYQHEVVALQNAGRTPHELHEIEEASRATTKAVPTATYEENLKVINETTGAFGSLHHAIENLTFMQKSSAVLKSAAGDKIQGGAGELGNKLARFFEERQVAGDTPTFQREAEGLVRAMAFTRGNFNPHEALNFAQQAKSALPNYSERFLTKIAPSLVTMLGGERAGTAANAFNSVLTGKVNDKKQAEEWMRYGLLDPKQVVMKAGHAVGWRAGAVKDTNQALSDPLKWVEEVMLPAMKAKGVKTEDRLELTKALATMFRNTNSNVFANDLAQPASRTRLHKDEELMGKAGTLDEIYQRNVKTDPTASIVALTTSLDNLMTTASSPAMATAASAITAVGTAINALADMAKDHPLLAMGGATVAAGGAAAGAGLLSYKLMNGFGLGTSAVALNESAAALTLAAGKLGGAGSLGNVTKGTAGAAAGAAAEVGSATLLSRLGIIVGELGAVAAPIMLLREIGEAHRPMTPEGAPYRLDQKIDPGTWERAARGRMEFLLDPEGKRARDTAERERERRARGDGANPAAHEGSDARGRLGERREVPTVTTPVPPQRPTVATPEPPARPADLSPRGDASGLAPLDTAAEATHGKLSALDMTVTPKGDASGLAPIGAAAEETKTKLAEVSGFHVAPTGDATSINALRTAVQGLLADLARIPGAASTARTAVANIGGAGSTGSVKTATQNSFSQVRG